ncbi:MAG: GNAT family N-acetyltransferase [Rhizobiaceae bacterium]
MFGHLLGNRATPTLRGERVTLRAPRRQDFSEWAELRAESSAFLRPWEPTWSEEELSSGAFRERRMRATKDANAGYGFVFLIFHTQTNELAGGITLGAIRYGVARSGQIGYWMGEKFSGKGLMQDAVKTLCGFGFETLRLHRLEAACIPSNERSIKVLEKTGFTREGLLKSYLKINGMWQDHLLFARISGVTDE